MVETRIFFLARDRRHVHGQRTWPGCGDTGRPRAAASLKTERSARSRPGSIGFGDRKATDEFRDQAVLEEVFRLDVAEDLALLSILGGDDLGVATLEDLDEASLKLILTQPKNALLKQYQRLFEMEGVDLTVAEEALGAIAKRAIDRKTGARGLRSIIVDAASNFPKCAEVKFPSWADAVISRPDGDRDLHFWVRAARWRPRGRQRLRPIRQSHGWR